MVTAAEPDQWRVLGQLTDASNATLLVERDGLRYIYKPVRGERPLWDFPDGTLGRHEVAAYEMSRLLGWDIVPATQWVTDAPFGPGSMQSWVDGDPTAVAIFAQGEVPADWLPVLSGIDEDNREVEVAHRTDLQAMALFDILTNNADRKGSHILRRPDGTVQGIDHGLCFHHEAKLRTVLWGFVGQPIPADLLADVERVLAQLPQTWPGLTEAEVAAVRHRARQVLQLRHFPAATVSPAIPWPPL